MTTTKRLVILRIALLISLAFRSTAGEAVGLGPMRLQSALGQPLRASVQVLGADNQSLVASCIRTRLRSPDGSEILRPDIELRRTNGSATEILVTSSKVVDEPAVSLLIEITCSPTLNRDYQLLLDLSDGLPRVVSNLASDATQEARPRVALNATGTGGEGGVERRRIKRKPRKQNAPASLSTGLNEPDTMPTGSENSVVRSRAKGLPGARNILKLSQENISVGKSEGNKPPDTLQLSHSLSAPKGSLTITTDEVNAAKTRFQAMMRGEDPILTAQKEIRGLQVQLQQAVVDATAKAEAASTKAPPKGLFKGMPAFNIWLIGLAVLMIAAVGMVSFFLHRSRRTGSKDKTPWWQGSAQDTSRETELVQSARVSIDKKKAAPEKKTTAAPVDSSAVSLHARQDKALQRYVDHFIGAGHKGDKSDKPDDPSVTRIEPQGLTIPASEVTKAPDPVTPSSDSHFLDTNYESPRTLSNKKHATFELVSDVMQEAEFWKMLKEPQRAIDILENYCNTESAASPVPWLFLGDLYAGTGDQQRLAQLRERFRTMFNGRFDKSDDDGMDSRDSLEDYPHLMEKISGLWGDDSVLPFLQGLLINDRDAPREGFYLPVYLEILLLIDIAHVREKIAA